MSKTRRPNYRRQMPLRMLFDTLGHIRAQRTRVSPDGEVEVTTLAWDTTDEEDERGDVSEQMERADLVLDADDLPRLVANGGK